MSKKEKFEPDDSSEKEAKGGKAVKENKDKSYSHKEPEMKNPEKARKYSEQPPNEQNNRS